MIRFAPSRRSFLTLLSVALALGCGDGTRSTAPFAPSFSNRGGIGNAYAYGRYRLAACSTRQPHFNAALVDAAGGILEVGPNRLAVPAGALEHSTLLSGLVLPIDVVNVEFGPEGLQFEVPARLTLNTTGCDIPPGVTPSIVYVKDGKVVEVIPSVFDRLHNRITGPVHHFSGYSIAF